MQIRILILLTLLNGFGYCQLSGSAEGLSFHERVMNSTYKIGDGNSSGTVFMAESTSGSKRPVLITAAHVLEGFNGSTATLVLRRAVAENQFVRMPVLIQTRRGGKALWLRHPEVDVAAMHVNTISQGKDSIPFAIPSSLFASEDTLRQISFGPGAELCCMGYPLDREANDAGFPILRSGKVASYPVLPIKETKLFLLDFEVFQGNSGGPVYVVASNPKVQGVTRLGEELNLLLGIVSQQGQVVQVKQSVTEILIGGRHLKIQDELREPWPLKIGVVMHGFFARELVDQLSRGR